MHAVLPDLHHDVAVAILNLQFLIKFKNLSYLNCRWISALSWLKDCKARGNEEITQQIQGLLLDQKTRSSDGARFSGKANVSSSGKEDNGLLPALRDHASEKIDEDEYKSKSSAKNPSFSTSEAPRSSALSPEMVALFQSVSLAKYLSSTGIIAAIIEPRDS